LNQTELYYETIKHLEHGYGSKIAWPHQSFDGTPTFKSSGFTTLNEKVISDYAGLMIPLNHFMFNVLNDKIMQLQESGIMQKLFKSIYPKYNTITDPVPLSLDHLLIWFQLWAALILISISFFFGEILVNKMLQIRRKRNGATNGGKSWNEVTTEC
jgi:hypothetical protein